MSASIQIFKRQTRRGSAMVLVVAILAVLLLLSISLSYTSKMDLLSARNWGNTVRSRVAAATGVPLFVPSTADSASGATVALRAPVRQYDQYGNLIGESSSEDGSGDTVTDASGRVTSTLDTADDEGIPPVAMRLKVSEQGYAYSFARGALTPNAGATPYPTPIPFAPSRLQPASAGKSQFAGAMIPAAQQARGLTPTQITSQTLAMLRSDPFNNKLAQVKVLDTAAKLNINAVIPVDDPFKPTATGSTAAPAAATTQTGAAAAAAPSAQITQDTLARLITAVTQGQGLGTVDAKALAHAIALRRYGADEAPGIKGVDDNANGRAVQAGLDSVDNNHDRQIDDLSEEHSGITQDEQDNDRNGVVDDLEETIENDGIDNNLNGQIDEAGESIDDPAECSSDPRVAPAGDDRPYVSLSELTSVPGMTVDIYRALEPYLTIFSVSNNAFELTGASGATSKKEEGWPRVDPNTASPERIYSALKHRFPDKKPGVLAQFTVNLIDRRDPDNVPTTLTFDGVTVTGIEMTPFINEVCPDVSSTDAEGDNGEFIELFNPWSKPVNLAGYTLRGEGVNITLTQTLPPNGYIVFTDDYDNSDDPQDQAGAQSGSFYDIFGVAAMGYGAQLVVEPTLDIADEAGTITLVNAKGETVDSFTWTNGKWDGRPYSFQRGDPRLRATRYAQATPLKANADFDTNAGNRQLALEMQEKWQNQPFRSALDVMLVSTAYADGSSTTGTKLGGNPWALPTLADENGKNLDAGLVDVFAMGAVLPPAMTADALQETNGSGTLPFGQANTQRRVRPSYLTHYLQNLPRCDRSFGAININTATPAVLSALPGMTNALLQKIFKAREDQAKASQMQDQQEGIDSTLQDVTQAGDGLQAPRWHNLSDLLRDETLWDGAALYERLDQLYPFSGLLATSSLALEIHTEDRSLDSVASEEGRRRSTSEATRIISGDRGAIETVFFEFGGRGNDTSGDPDLRYAVPSTKVAGLNIAMMFPDFDTSKIPYGVEPFGTIPAIADRVATDPTGKIATRKAANAKTAAKAKAAQQQMQAKRAGKMIPPTQ